MRSMLQVVQNNHAAAHHRPLRILNWVPKSVLIVCHAKKAHEDVHDHEVILFYVCGMPSALGNLF